MPTYEYRCPRCGHQFEARHAVNAAPPKCERCGRAVRRVFTPVGIIFKGTGWHITDYRKTPAPVEGETKKSESAASGKASGDGGKSGSAAADGGSKSSDGSTSRGGTKSDGARSKPASRAGGGRSGS
ncbi:MAG TPA: FmdB family zinc ribbon protein [bacterium]|nr:FmdB family zinc ribbon protein [bacterium]